MPRCRRPCRAAGLLAAAVGAVLVVTSMCRGQVSETRPATEAIRSELRDLVRDPGFRPTQSLWQRIEEFFSNRSTNRDLSGGWAAFLYWFIVFWCVVTLLAIVGHLVWGVFIAARGSSRRPAGGGCAPPDLSSRSPGELYALARETAAEGRYTEALHYLMLAVLRRLDAMEAIRFHESKTDGDYLREYTQGPEPRERFAGVLQTFERSVYAGVLAPRSAYEDIEQYYRGLET